MPLSKPDRNSNSTIAVTGASSGIGAEMAKVLAARGYGLTLIARRTDRLEALADELKSAHGVEVKVIGCDLADPAARADLSARLESGPALIGLVNNAGFGSYGEIAEADGDAERMMVEVNVDAVHDLMIRLLPGMLARGEGAILNTASTASAQPVPYMATYAATKAFVISLSEAANAELAGTGVSVTALCPGPVKTEFSTVAGSQAMENAMPSMALVSAEQVAREAIDAMIRGSRTVVPGFANKVSLVGGRVAPRSLVLPIAKRMSGR